MSEPKTIKINEVEYVRKDATNDTDGDIRIVVLDRGLVYIGRVKIENDFVVISSARNIRVWGTTQGLGQLVSGPLPVTKLDVVGTVKAPMRALISLIDVEQSKWSVI